jgi:hypothetical protein
MTVLTKEEKYLKCRRRHTSECPHVDHPAMKKIDDTNKALLGEDKKVDRLSMQDYKNAKELCGQCYAFYSE